MSTCGGEGVGVALVEAAGEMLQHALSLLSLADQYHHFQERPERRIQGEQSNEHVFHNRAGDDALPRLVTPPP